MCKVLQIPGTVLRPHFQGVEYMDGGRAVPMIRQRRDHIRIELIPAALLGYIGTRPTHHLQKGFCVGRHLLHPLFDAVIEELPLEFSVPDQRIQQRHRNVCHKLCLPWSRLVHVGAAQDADVQPDPLPRGQQTHKTAAQAAPIGRMKVPAAVSVDVILDLPGLIQHCGKGSLRLGLVKAVVGDAQDVEIRFQQREHPAEIAFPVAAGTGQKQQRRLGRIAE